MGKPRISSKSIGVPGKCNNTHPSIFKNPDVKKKCAHYWEKTRALGNELLHMVGLIHDPYCQNFFFFKKMFFSSKILSLKILASKKIVGFSGKYPRISETVLQPLGVLLQCKTLWKHLGSSTHSTKEERYRFDWVR